jgi:NitT/TauT family transport system substrate-binding protein
MPLHRHDFLKAAACATLGELVSHAVPAAAADDPRVVRVLSTPADAAKQVLYAQHANLFRKRGIQAEISPMGSGAAIIAAVVGGSAEFGSGSLFPVFSAFGHNIPIRIVAPISIYASATCDTFLLVSKDSPMRTPRDLNGKIMGADAPNDIYITSTRLWLDQRGGDGKSIRAVELKAGEQLAALDQGRIDMVVLKPPFLTVALESGKVRVLGKPLDVIAPRFLVSCWVATVDYIAKNPDIVNAFAAGLTEAARYTNTHQPATIDLVAAFSGQDPSLLGHGVRTVIAESITLADVQKPLDFAFKYGVIDQHYDAGPMLAASVPMSRGR